MRQASVFQRAQAAELAAKMTEAFSGQSDSTAQLQATARSWADFWFAWLVAKQAARFRITALITSPHGKTTTATVPDGGTMSTQMTMDDTITLTGQPEDDHGDPTSDVLSFAADDGGTLLSLSTDGNTATGTPLGEGTVNVTVSDPAAPNLQPSVVTIDIGAGPTSQVQVGVAVNPGANAVPPVG